ncbi:hypothetical protein C8R42DRAFT_360367 [Lentinula raphanica]|nr:hypothetical protein C8R42DRAFT_360367 [Lentinula raphanica]
MVISLPNELLHSIIEYIAYISIPPEMEPSFPLKFLTKRTSPELLVLSVSDWRLRRVCLPFLFANIRIRNDEDAQKLSEEGEGQQYLPLFSTFTTRLVIGGSDEQEATLTETGDDIISQILPQLKQLLHVEVQDVHSRTDLLRSILAHPTITSVLVHELPDIGMLMHDDDLSKVVIGNEVSLTPTFSPHFEECLNRGMGLASLDLWQPETLETQSFRTISGLEKLQLHMDFHPVSSSWMSNLSSSQPMLNELWLEDAGTRYFSRHPPPFISSFVEESSKQNLKTLYQIKCIGLRRSVGQCSQEWNVIGIGLNAISTSLIGILQLVASSFPKLERVSLGTHQATYDIGDLASVFVRFSSLRVMFLDHISLRLDFETEDTNHTESLVSSADSTYPINGLLARAESEFLRVTSLLAKRSSKRVRTVDSFHINQTGLYHLASGFSQRWHLRGWLHVLNGNRDVGGTLEQIIEDY